MFVLEIGTDAISNVIDNENILTNLTELAGLLTGFFRNTEIVCALAYFRGREV